MCIQKLAEQPSQKKPQEKALIMSKKYINKKHTSKIKTILHTYPPSHLGIL